MNNGKKPAFQTSIGMSTSEMENMGISKREYFAIQILSGMNANGMTTQEGVEPPYCMTKEDRCRYAVEQADALLEELTFKQNQNG